MKAIEDKIKDLVSKETLRAAKELYQSGAVIFCYLDNTKAITFIVKDKNNLIHTIKIKDFNSFIKGRNKKNYSPILKNSTLNYI